MEKMEKEEFQQLVNEHRQLGISKQEDYVKLSLYSLVTNSTAMEGSTMTGNENQMLFDEGISVSGRSKDEQMMNIDLVHAYEQGIRLARGHCDFSIDMLKGLSAWVMRNVGAIHSVADGENEKGGTLVASVGSKLDKINMRVSMKLKDFCHKINERRKELMEKGNKWEEYMLSFDAHYWLIALHPWTDGNGRMSRLIMNYLQFEFGLLPTIVNKEHREAYVRSMEESKEQDSLEPFRNFMIKEHAEYMKNEIDTFKKYKAYNPLLAS